MADRTNGLNNVDIGSGRRGFRNRNLGLGQAGTIVDAEWANGLQEEVVRTLELLGLTPSAVNREQLIQALRRLASGNITTLSANTTLTADSAGLVQVSASGGNVTLILPAVNAAGGAPLRFDILRTDTSGNTLTVQRAGSDTIEGATSLTIPPGGRLALIGDGASIWRQGTGPGRLLGVRVFSSTQTYTQTPGTRYVIVEAAGGGGGGAGSVATGASGTSIGTPGAAGAGGIGLYTSGFSGVTVTIGAAGTAGGTGGNGGTGGTTSFGALLSCPGGTGGQASGANTVLITGGQGNTSVPTGANIRAFASDGGGVCISASLAAGYGGGGGRSIFGPGGNAVSINQNGSAGIAPGSGGSGTAAFNNGVGLNGAAGAAGLCVIWEYA